VVSLYFRVGVGNARVVDQVPDFQGQGPAQGNEQVQGRGQLADTFCLRAGEQLVPAPGLAERTDNSANGAGEESGFLPSVSLVPRATDKGATRR